MSAVTQNTCYDNYSKHAHTTFVLVAHNNNAIHALVTGSESISIVLLLFAETGNES